MIFPLICLFRIIKVQQCDRVPHENIFTLSVYSCKSFFVVFTLSNIVLWLFLIQIGNSWVRYRYSYIYMCNNSTTSNAVRDERTRVCRLYRLYTLTHFFLFIKRCMCIILLYYIYCCTRIIFTKQFPCCVQLLRAKHYYITFTVLYVL